MQAQPKSRSRINDGFGMFTTLFQRLSEALFRSWLVLGFRTVTPSICCTELDPAAGDFGIELVLDGHAPPHGLLMS